MHARHEHGSTPVDVWAGRISRHRMSVHVVRVTFRSCSRALEPSPA
jgi:hypothetical protein